MALLTPVQATFAGAVTTKVAASAGGDTFAPGNDLYLHVRNDAVASRTVTIVVPGTAKYGGANPDSSLAIAAGAEASFGPFPADLADPGDGLVDVTYSDSAASVFVRLVRA